MPAHPTVVLALFRAHTLPELITKRAEILDALTAPDSIASDNLDGVGNSFNNDDLDTLTQKLENIQGAIAMHEAGADAPTRVRGRLMHYHRAAE